LPSRCCKIGGATGHDASQILIGARFKKVIGER
jgi:hypothetical protein